MKLKVKQDILHGNVTINLLLLMYPILLCGIFQQLYQMADAIVVGQFSKSSALAIVGGSASMIIGIFTGLSGGIVIGSMFVTAFFSGQRNHERVRCSTLMSLFISIVFGVISTIVIFLFGYQILNILQVPTDILSDSNTYIKIYSLGYTPYFIFQICINILRALGETRRPTRYLIISFVLNICLDYIFTGVFKLEQNGVALAFITSQTICAYFILRNISIHLDLTFHKFVFDQNMIKKILSIGIPSSITSIIYALTNLLIQSSFNLLGSQMVASYAIHGKIESVYWIFFTGLSMAIATFAGQNYGAENFNRIKQTVHKGIFLGYFIAIPLSLLFFFVSVPLVSIFTSDTTLIEQSSAILRYMAPFYLCYPVIEVLSQILKCIGKATQVTIITLLSISVIRVSWIISVAMKNLTYETILFAFPLSWTIAACIFIVYYFIERKIILNEELTRINRTNPWQTKDR